MFRFATETEEESWRRRQQQQQQQKRRQQQQQRRQEAEKKRRRMKQGGGAKSLWEDEDGMDIEVSGDTDAQVQDSPKSLIAHSLIGEHLTQEFGLSGSSSLSGVLRWLQLMAAFLSLLLTCLLTEEEQ